MPSNDRAETWFRLFSPTIRFPETIRYPGGGDMGGFRYEPVTTWEAPSLAVGNPAIEQRVLREVASPGRQLGRLTDAVLELADQLAPAGGAPEPERIRALRELHEKIEAIKKSVGDSAEQVAREGLDRLAQSDPARLESLVEEYRKKADEA